MKTTIVPILGPDGKALEYVSLRTDVTDLESANQKLEDSMAELSALDSKKDEFVSIASHELRTPLTAVRGYASMIGDAESLAEAKKYALEISKSSDRMIEMVNDMLSVSKMEAGREAFESVPTDLAEIAESVTEELSAIAKGRGVELVCERQAPAVVIADPGKLRRALENLVGNAIKFTPKH